MTPNDFLLFFQHINQLFRPLAVSQQEEESSTRSTNIPTPVISFLAETLLYQMLIWIEKYD